MRLFLAIDIDQSLAPKIQEIMNQFTAGFDITFVRPKNLHITLKFLGEVSQRQIETIQETVSQTLKNQKPFNLTFRGVGYFGPKNRPRVLWIDIEKGKDILTELCKTLDISLRSIRPPDHEPHPHLTFGRVRSLKNTHSLLETIRNLHDVKVGDMNVNEISLKQSILKPQGPAYSTYETVLFSQ